MMKNQAFLRLSASILFIILFSFNSRSQVTTLIVSECNQQGWSIVPSGNAVFTFFPSGPTLPPLQEGSGQFNINSSRANVSLQTAIYGGNLLASFSELTYFTYVENSSPSGEDIFIVLNVDYNGDGLGDDQLTFQPSWQTGPILTSSLWNQWDAIHGLWSSLLGEAGATQSNPKSLLQIISIHPLTKLANGNSMTVCAGSAAGWSGFQGNIDALKISVGANKKLFDFESSESLNTIWFRDADGDGWGNTNISVEDCTQPAGYVSNNYDCDDNNTKKKEQILICRDHKEKCIKPEELQKHLREGYIVGPCEVPCKGNKVLMCHDGKMKCVKPEEVEKKILKGWTVGRCGAEQNPSLAAILNAPAAINISSFPNPTTGKFSVDLGEFKNQKIVLELSGDGAQVIERKTVLVSAKGNVESFDLSTKKPGLYILKVINENDVHSIKIIVTR